MAKLESISNPQVGTGRETTAVATRKISPGSAGTKAVGDSIAARKLLGRGKGDPIERPAAVAAPRTSGRESVIGTDDRVRILETELGPWRMICGLEMESPFGNFVGTGWFVGPKTLVTAGHCVFDRSAMGGWATSIRVTPGRDEADFPFGQVVSSRFSTVDRWFNEQNADFDYGAIHLDDSIGEQTGWFSLGALADGELLAALANISGYPADRGFGRQQWFHKNRVLHVSDRRVFYDVDTFGGQSGSPVWIYESEAQDAPPIAVGIHAYGIGGTPSGLGLTANSAPRISPEVHDQITEWIEADGGLPTDDTGDADGGGGSVEEPAAGEPPKSGEPCK